MRFVLHTFRPSETIDAVLRLLGRHDLTQDELAPLRRQFNVLNGEVVPRPGMMCKIPLPEGSIAAPRPEFYSSGPAET